MNEGLEVQVTATHLLISIGLGALAYSTENAPTLWDGEKDAPTVRITDQAGWAKDVAHELEREEEDGITPLHLLFDAAFEKAIEDGSLNIELIEPSKEPR